MFVLPRPRVGTIQHIYLVIIINDFTISVTNKCVGGKESNVITGGLNDIRRINLYFHGIFTFKE